MQEFSPLSPYISPPAYSQSSLRFLLYSLQFFAFIVLSSHPNNSLATVVSYPIIIMLLNPRDFLIIHLLTDL